MIRPLMFGVWIVFSLVAILSHETAHASNINWLAPEPITGNSNVTNGSIFAASAYAFNLAAASNIPINGVTFVPFHAPGNASTTVGDITISTSGGTVNGHDNTFGSSSAPFASLSSEYQSLLASGVDTTSTPLTVTFSNLHVDGQYRVEIWVNDSHGGTGRSETISDGPTLSFNTDGEGGVGQYITGLFIGESTSRSFTLTGTAGSGALLNAIIFQEVPEPAAATLVIVIITCASNMRTRH